MKYTPSSASGQPQRELVESALSPPGARKSSSRFDVAAVRKRTFPQPVSPPCAVFFYVATAPDVFI